MARQCTFFLMGWLFCIHVTAALAVTPLQKRARKSPPLPRQKKTVVFPKKGPPVDSAVFPKTPVRQVPTTIAEDATKPRRYVAEETVMQRAWIYSAILPGWGQIYNEQYWKAPVIYVGFAGFLGGTIYYHREYMQAKRAIMHSSSRMTSLVNYVDECRTGRDLCIILAALWYVVNIFDAYVGGSLKTFTLSDDISMEVQPTVLPTIRNLPTMGLSLTLRFKNENTLDRLWKDGSGY
jgi:hypothetical protein